MTEAAALRLPPLRRDLELSPGPSTVLGQPTWTLHDPAANRFFRLGPREVEILAAWEAGAPADVAESAALAGRLNVDESDVQQLGSFLSRNHLLRNPSPEAVSKLLALDGMKRGPKHWLRSYLFFRIHLLRPDGLLERLGPKLSFLFTTRFAVFAALLCLTSLVLLLRQWELFLATVPDFINMRGAALMMLAVFSAKILHELAHGLPAKRYGLSVTSMGVAFLVLWPVLFTNVTQSWKLNDARQRTIIGAAGIAAELLLAGLAGFGWLLLDPGWARDICFVLAATSWTMSLAVNLNPFMRFDGYYLLSDALGVDNLLERGQALLTWRTREFFADYGDAPPEKLPRRLAAIVMVHAVGGRIYRTFLALSIAALVYALAFKALGICLALASLHRSLLAPLMTEISKYWQRRGELDPRRFSTRTLGILSGLAFLLFWPWSGTVSVDGLLTAERTAGLYAPFDGIIAKAPADESIAAEAGKPLFVIESSALGRQLAVARVRERAARHDVSVLGMDREKLQQRLKKQAELEELHAAIDALEQQLAESAVAPTIDGRLELPAEPYAPGDWVAEGALLARIAGGEGVRIVAYVDELDLGRIRPGGKATFHHPRPEAGSVDCVVQAIDATAADRLENLGFASPYGGDIPATASGDGHVTLRQSVYRIILAPEEPGSAPGQESFGRISIKVERTALAGRIYKKIKSLLVRELGF